jgi:glycosyltransferase involved in cell wall biosynthesis
MRRLRLAAPSGFWRALGEVATDFDLIDVNISEPPLVRAGMPLGIGPMVLTLHAPVERLRRWPYAHAVRALVAVSHRILCSSADERDLLSRAFPHAAGRGEVLGPGVDALAIRAAMPFVSEQTIVLVDGRLERKRRVDRAIAAMPSLDPRFRLVILGDGPDRRRLEAYAADLRVAGRVTFAGATSPAVQHRWLRTARVFVALAGEDTSGVHMMEALAAGASVVASEIPVHREVIERVGHGTAFFVSPDGSPLDVADAIELAAQQPASAGAPVPSWESVLDTAWNIYREVVLEAAQVCYIDHRRWAAS